MKGLYIAPVDKNVKNYGGVYKKIQSQIKAFQSFNIEMNLIVINGYNLDFMGNLVKFPYKYFQHYFFFRYILKNIDLISSIYDFVYIRFSFANPYMFKLAKKLSKLNKKVIVEIPTYPYDDEISNNFKNIILKKIDKFLWKTQNKWINNLVLTNDLDSLFNIQAINIFNGVNVDEITINERDKMKNELNLIGVANISNWHGYDRVINGIYEYYQNKGRKDVHFYIIGEGIEKENLRKLSIALNVEDRVHILGAKYNEELENIYKKMDVGISSLALFRAGGGHDPIKSKEYIAKGLPVIVGYKDRAFTDQLSFVFEIPEDNTPLNIEKVIQWYETINMKNSQISNYATENLSWESQIKKIIDKILS